MRTCDSAPVMPSFLFKFSWIFWKQPGHFLLNQWHDDDLPYEARYCYNLLSTGTSDDLMTYPGRAELMSISSIPALTMSAPLPTTGYHTGLYSLQNLSHFQLGAPSSIDASPSPVRQILLSPHLPKASEFQHLLSSYLMCTLASGYGSPTVKVKNRIIAGWCTQTVWVTFKNLEDILSSKFIACRHLPWFPHLLSALP